MHLDDALDGCLRFAIVQMPESALLCGSRLFCVTTISIVSIVSTTKAFVPVRAEDGFDPPYLHGR
jgi:hypothetical protein